MTTYVPNQLAIFIGFFISTQVFFLETLRNESEMKHVISEIFEYMFNRKLYIAKNQNNGRLQARSRYV